VSSRNTDPPRESDSAGSCRLGDDLFAWALSATGVTRVEGRLSTLDRLFVIVPSLDPSTPAHRLVQIANASCQSSKAWVAQGASPNADQRPVGCLHETASCSMMAALSGRHRKPLGRWCTDDTDGLMFVPTRADA
jgi:hypothetical protein